MLTQINTPDDYTKVLNENLEGLLTGKRKIPVVKEVNNTVGKMMDRYKLEAISKSLCNDRTPLDWFRKQLGDK